MHNIQQHINSYYHQNRPTASPNPCPPSTPIRPPTPTTFSLLTSNSPHPLDITTPFPLPYPLSPPGTLLHPMAYTLYITCPPHYRSPHRRKLRASAWADLIASDPSLSLLPPESHPDGPAAAFQSHPNEPTALFRFRDGNILCANPDEHAVAKLLQLATALGAHLQGEDGEIHTSPTDAPHLVQFTLFDRVSRRLRVRFPLPAARRRTPNLIAMLPETVVLNVSQNLPISPEITPTTPPRETTLSQSTTITYEEINTPAQPPAKLIAVPQRLGRMSVGFPQGTPKPSRALQSLLTPLPQPSQPTASPHPAKAPTPRVSAP